jgi:exodeoxyribonuclease V alpha subunit
MPSFCIMRNSTDKSSMKSVKTHNNTPEIFLRGAVNGITYQNRENGFAVIKVLPENVTSSQDAVTLIGGVPASLGIGSNVIARGRWETHPKFGKQFRAFSVTESAPTSEQAIIKYLASSSIKGFGPVLATRIVKKFGNDALTILDKHPERLIEVNGVGHKKLKEITESWQESRNVREVMLFFQGHNISANMAQRIYRSYGDRAIETVKKNPYILTRDVWGIGFKTADKIAQELGLPLNSPVRLSAGILYALKKASDDGHCFLPREYLLTKAIALLSLKEDCLEDLENSLKQSLLSGEVIEYQGNIYLSLLERAETILAKSLVKQIHNSPEETIPKHILKNFSENPMEVRNSGGPELSSQIIHLSEEQKKAIIFAAEHSIVVITGGPGCGKTTVVRSIAKMFRAAGLELKLAAPTGKAAQRLAEVCGIEASTIHRLLKFDPLSRSFLYNEQDRLPLDAIIIDESSMIDLALAASLFQAIPKGARVVVVGDADQLPSVGPGRFLSDLLEISKVPRVKLTTLFRRADESSITHIAHQVNSAIVPNIPSPDGKTKSDSYFLSASDPIEAAELVERLVVEQIPKKFGIPSSDITVLTPMNKGELGIISLNNRLQKSLVPENTRRASVKVGNLEFRLHDKVCQRVNNYNIVKGGVFNGDQGEIIAIDTAIQTLTVLFWDGRTVEYSTDALYQLDLAYAITIHRSQGSEMPAVVLVLHDSHSMILERQLIYTAITRAKQLLIVVGSKRALVLSVRKSRGHRRYTALATRCNHLLNEGNQ